METGSDALQRYLADFTYELVAETGNPNDRYHLGKIILKQFKEDPDFLLQIDGATDERDTFGSMLVKSVRCAEAFRRLGIKKGDIIVLMAPNCLDLTAPLYAAFYLGISVACIDMHLLKDEIVQIFNDTRPKFVFCLASKAAIVSEVVHSLDIDTQITTFGKDEKFNTFPEFLDEYSKNDKIDEFRVEDFDPKETIAVLISTSGTTGLPKVAALTHSNCIIGLSYIWPMIREFPNPEMFAIILSPVQWLSAHVHYIFSPILKYRRVQSSQTETREHVYDLINKYKPTTMVCSPTFMIKLLAPGEREKCNFSSFKWVFLGGSAVAQEVVEELRKVHPKTSIYRGYGLTECTGLCFDIMATAYRDTCGTPLKHLQYRLVDIDTQEDITKPNVQGELWIKGPPVFKGYWKRPKETEAALTKDGWLRSGDLFYRDEHWYFYFVDRYKLLLKYRNHQISPTEIETVIRRHPEVLDVAVTSLPDLECGDLPVACVTRVEGSTVSAQEIKDIVKNNLTDTKRLRGGVIFLKELPTTRTGKVDRNKLKSIVQESKEIL
ncbi:unnamed protein product [Leptosia nina]|uniref:Luciferin 4-monooxygenase n=1 Tax=Leptosia nina TaxID=320188 RepID=A0AAV1IYH2_9NEOP